MENLSNPSARSINKVYSDFYKNHYQSTIKYWTNRSRITREEIEDIISSAIQEHFQQVSQAADPQPLLNCAYILGIVRNKIYTAFRQLCICCKPDDGLDDDDALTITCGNAPIWVYIDELSGPIDGDGEFINRGFSRIEYELYCDEANASGLEHYRRQLRRRLYELLHTLEPNHELLFRYHYGLGLPKLTFAEMAPLIGFSNGDSAKVVFDRKKKQLIKLAHAA